jgi:Protein of unknown function, DUF481
MHSFSFLSREGSRPNLRMRLWLPALLMAASASAAHAQKAPAPAAAPDVIVFANGDQLTGKFLREVNGTVTFHSDIAGDVSVTWDKIKSIHSADSFAVVQKGQEVSRKKANTEIVRGPVQIQDDKVEVTPASGAPKDIATKDTQFIIDQPTFDKEVNANPSFLHGWNGSITGGATLVQATQNSRSFAASIALQRTIPTVNWLDPRNRTTVDLNSAYGEVTQPGTITTKTNIIHFDAEHDWYLTPRLYALVDMSLDHVYSQGLDLQQIYGGGLGYTWIKTPRQEFDTKFDIHFERQTFFITPNIDPPPPLTPSKNLIGANFGETYMLKLPKGLVWNEGAVITPAFNQADAWSATATTALLFPVYKRLGFSLGALDDYLNTPAVGSKRNSFQFTAGVTYTLK